MPIPTDRLHTVALAVLAAVVEGYAAEGVALPARRFVAPGGVAYDCEQLAVTCEQVFGHDGNPATAVVTNVQQANAWAMRAGTFGIHLVRCVPEPNDDGTPPAADDLTAAAEVLHHDAVLLLNSLRRAVKVTGTLMSGRRVAFLTWQPVGPSGGVVGGLFRVSISLDTAP